MYKIYLVYKGTAYAVPLKPILTDCLRQFLGVIHPIHWGAKLPTLS